jgi:hypothetical protein
MSSTASELPPIVAERIAAVNAFDTAALIASRPDGIYESVGTRTIPFALALRGQGYKGPIVMSSAEVSASQIKQLGSSAGDLILNSNIAHSSLAWNHYQANLNKCQPAAAAGVGDSAL